LAASLVAAALLLGGCSAAGLPRNATPIVAKAALGPTPPAVPRPAAGDLDYLISRYASIYGVPASLVHRVVQRESGYNPRARNGPYMGLMQIHPSTAKSMGYSGAPAGLLDAETNLKYGVKYLAGAYMVANNNADQAVRNYARGYYYDAKRMGLLEETGLR
jgi:soluble lytic murein transglycosylase-like protein